MYGKYRAVARLGQDHAPQVSIDFTNAIVITGCRNAIATRRSRRITDEVITFVNSKDKERVLARNPICGETIKELLECCIVIVQLLSVTSLARTISEVNIT